MPSRFAGKVAVVIGGNSGVGLAAAQAFTNEGAKVLITGRDAGTLKEAVRQIGNEALAHRSDVSDLQQIRSLFALVGEQLGRIDVLLVNAGVLALMPVATVTESEWDRIMDINVKGAFFSIQGALPLMQEGSAIVLTGSIASMKAAVTASVYAASKAALRALGRSLAAELVERGIRVNVVSPGYTETPIYQRTPGLSSDSMAAFCLRAIDRVPMKRAGTPEEVAAAILFLASDDAAFITGIDLLVDGGTASF